MRKLDEYIPRVFSIFLAIILFGNIIPVVEADDEYLDGGFLGLPAWAYKLLDNAIMNEIIGTIHGHTLFGPIGYYSEDIGIHSGWNHPLNPRMKIRLFW